MNGMSKYHLLAGRLLKNLGKMGEVWGYSLKIHNFDAKCKKAI